MKRMRQSDGKRREAWKNWPPKLWDKPVGLTEQGTGEAVVGEVINVQSAYVIGDWVTIEIDGLTKLASRDGTVARWNILTTQYKPTDGLMYVIRRIKPAKRAKSNDCEGNWLTGGTEPDGTPSVLFGDWIQLGEWYTQGMISGFNDGFAVVSGKAAGKSIRTNYIGRNGKMLLDDEFARTLKSASDFNDGFACITSIANKMNLIDRTGKVVSQQWYAAIGPYCAKAGLAPVKNDDYMRNFIKADGTLAFKAWFADGSDFGKDGLAWVKVPGRGPAARKGLQGWNLISGPGNSKGEPTFISKNWLPSCVASAMPFRYGVSMVRGYYSDNRADGYGFVGRNLKPVTRMDLNWASGTFEIAGLWGKIEGVADDAGGILKFGENRNMMKTDGTLFFRTRADDRWLKNVDSKDVLSKDKDVHATLLSENGELHYFTFPVGDEYEDRVSLVGVPDRNVQRDEEVVIGEGSNPRIEIGRILGRTDTDLEEWTRIHSAFLVRDSSGGLHAICLKDGTAAKNAELAKMSGR